MLPQSQVLFQMVGLHLVEDSKKNINDKAMWLSGTREAGLMIAGEWRLRLTMLEVRVLLKREPSTMVEVTCLSQPLSCKLLFLKVIVLYNVTD